jgi:hypothetical protein
LGPPMNLTYVIPRLREELREIEAAILNLERLQRRSRRRGMARLLASIEKSSPKSDEMSERARRAARIDRSK